MKWKPAYALLLLGITGITFIGALLIHKAKETDGKKKALVAFFSLLGFLPLIVFKYYNFINESISCGLSTLGLGFSLPGLNLAIPVGISFFTFQAVGYMLDVYHGRIDAERNLTDYVLFVSFFPQVVSGPISKADELLPQLKREKSFSYTQAVCGLRYLLWGIFLKVVLADRAGIYVDTVFGSYVKFSGLGCFIASILYSIQIYSDFAGYSFMAVGVAKILGFDLINNFSRPYFAVSISDFWRRWHISLTRWLTQQVYIPLGGSRCGKLKTYRNVMITFLVSGIWHGANWTFIIWGVLHGFILVVEKALGIGKDKPKGVVKVFKIVGTFVIVTTAWVFFRSPSIGDAFGMISRYISKNGVMIADTQTLLYILVALIPFLLYECCSEFLPVFYDKVRRYTVVRWTAYIALTAMIVLMGIHDGSSFIYASF